jgi:hypothetical protein
VSRRAAAQSEAGTRKGESPEAGNTYAPEGQNNIGGPMLRLRLLWLIAGKSYRIAIEDERHRLRPAPKPRWPSQGTLATWWVMLVVGGWLAIRG